MSAIFTGWQHKGYLDERDMFPEAVRAVRELRPKAFIFENVKGLMRETFSEYFEYILMQLQHPGLKRKGTDEPWQDHRSRLERHQTSRGAKDPGQKLCVKWGTLCRCDSPKRLRGQLPKQCENRAHDERSSHARATCNAAEEAFGVVGGKRTLLMRSPNVRNSKIAAIFAPPTKTPKTKRSCT